MDDLFDTFELPVETRLRLRMADNKRRMRHRVLRGSAILMAFTVLSIAFGVQKIPGYVSQVLAPLQQVTEALHSLS